MSDDTQIAEQEERSDDTLANPNGIRYGWCYTDHKDGREIRKRFRQIDYIQDEKYAASVAGMLKKMGLPQPDIGQVYRGTYHDLLFLDDHGVVVRIGQTKVNDLIHPAIIQPLGWIDDKENEISVAIYPGVELMNDMGNADYAATKLQVLKTGLKRAGHGTTDVGAANTGIVHVDRGGVDMPITILLDPDSYYNGVRSTGDLGADLSRIRASVHKGSARPNKSEVLDDAITSISDLAQDMRGWEAFFKSHQPLRTRFWLSQKGRDDEDTPDPEYMKMFWDECRSLKQKPKNYIQHKYTPYVNENGVSVYRYSRHEIRNAALASPWTGNVGEQHIKRSVAPHKQKIFADIAVDASAYLAQHELYKRNINFTLQALNINADCYQYLTEEQKALPAVNVLRLNRTYFTSDDAADILQDMPVATLENDEVQRCILNLFDCYDIDIKDIPISLRDSPDFALKALPYQQYSFKQLIQEQDFAQGREFILKAVKTCPDIAENFIDNFWEDIDLMWACIRENPSRYDTMLKYTISEFSDEIPDDLRGNVDFVNRYIHSHDFDNVGYKILAHVDSAVVTDPKFRRFILDALKDRPSDVRYLPPILLEDRGYMSEILRAEPKVFFHLSSDMQRNERLARTALYADYKRKAGVCNDVDDQLLDDLYDGGDTRFRAYFFDLCANMGNVFDNLPDKYVQDKAFMLSVLDYGTANYYMFPEAMRGDPEVTKKAILLSADNACADVIEHIPDALNMNEDFVKEMLEEDERSCICFATFLLERPHYMPDMLREDAELLCTLGLQVDDGDGDVFAGLMAIDEHIIGRETKKELSCQMAYHHIWDAGNIPEAYLDDEQHVIELLEIDADLYETMPEHVRARKDVIEAALLNEDSYEWSIIKSIPQETLATLSIWNDAEYLDNFSSAIARHQSLYDYVPRILREDKNFSVQLVGKNVCLYKNLSYKMMIDQDIIALALRRSERVVMSICENITSCVDPEIYNQFAIWHDDKLQSRILTALHTCKSDFLNLPECLKDDREFLAKALRKDLRLFSYIAPELQQEREMLLKYFEIEGGLLLMERPDKQIFIPNAFHHDPDFMSDVFAHIGFERGYLPEALEKDKAFFDQAVLKSPKLLDDDEFMDYFNAAQYQRSLEDMADPEKWFNNHLVDAFNEDLRSALDARAEKYDHIVKREDGLCYEWVANVCPNKVTEQDGQILYNYAGQDNTEPLVYDKAIIADAFDTHKRHRDGQVGIYKLVHDKV